MTADSPRVDLDSLRALVTPTRDGGWRFDIGARADIGEQLDGNLLWALTDVDSYGWARSKERAEAKARKRMAKMLPRLVNLYRPTSVVRLQLADLSVGGEQ